MILPLLLSVLSVSSCELIEKKTVQTPEEVTVKVMEANANEGGEKTTYMGTVQSSKSTLLNAPVPGTLNHLKTAQGKKVRKGDIVAEISSESVNSALEIAAATLEQAEDGYSRMMKLYEKGGVTEVKKMEVETQLRTAKATYKAAKKAKEQCLVRAPFAGTVEEVMAHEGEELGLLAPIVRISDTEHTEIHFSVPEKEIGDIEIGERVTVEIPALEQNYERGVEMKNASGNLLSHSYDCTLSREETIPGLKPGMMVKVHRSRQSDEKRISVPAGAIFTGMNERYLWIVKDGIVEKRNIVPDGYSDSGILVSEGLDEGDLVIVEGARKVCTGMKVRTVR